ncbi:hypothetical protein ACLKA6_003603 [Drosophila palustris]
MPTSHHNDPLPPTRNGVHRTSCVSSGLLPSGGVHGTINWRVDYGDSPMLRSLMMPTFGASSTPKKSPTHCISISISIRANAMQAEPEQDISFLKNCFVGASLGLSAKNNNSNKPGKQTLPGMAMATATNMGRGYVGVWMRENSGLGLGLRPTLGAKRLSRCTNEILHFQFLK